MTKTIKFEDGTEIGAVSVFGAKREMRGAKRESLAMKLVSSYADIAARFIDGTAFSIVEIGEIEQVGEDGIAETVQQVQEFDKSGYIVAGDIVDHRDGTLTVYMGEKTGEELLEEENAGLLFELLTGEAF